MGVYVQAVCVTRGCVRRTLTTWLTLGGVTVGVRSKLARWLLLCAVVFGVVGMHHMTTATHASGDHGQVAQQHGVAGLSHHGLEVEFTASPAMAASDAGCCGIHVLDMVSPAPAHPMDGHDLLHMCMAVIAAGAVLLLFTSHLMGPADTVTQSGSVLANSFGRGYPPPRTHGRSLALVGVLRQ